MKKIIKTLLVVMVVVLALTAFVACGEECVHTGGTATCTEAAVCELCGESYGAPLGHTEAFVAAVQPTCTEVGISAKSYCSVCNTVFIDAIEIPALGHTMVDVAAKAPTCTVDGYTAHKACEVCGEKDENYVVDPALGHNIVEVEKVEPTCTEAGCEAYLLCTVCKATDDNDKPIAALGHTFVEGKCECGAEDPDYVAPHEHSYESVVTDPTCTEAGYTTYTCACGDTYTDDEVAATGHSYKYDICSACGEVDPAYASVTHRINFSIWETFDKETYADGAVVEYNNIFTFIYSKNSKVDGSSKSWDDFAGTLRFSFGTKTPTGKVPNKGAIQITADGAYTIKLWYVAGGDGRYFALLDAEGNVLSETTKETTKNGQGYAELVIPAAGTYYLGTPNDNNYLFQIELVAHAHTLTDVEGKAATCTEDGYTAHKVCACGYVEGKEVVAAGHTWDDADATIKTCTVCGEHVNPDFAGGKGTAEAPYLISTPAQLANISNYYDTYKYYKVADGVTTLDMTGVGKINLHGSFDGNGVELVNLTTALFERVGYQNSVETIKISNVVATMNNIDGRAFVRNIFNAGTTTFENVTLHGYIEGLYNMGSFYNYGTANCDGTGADYTVEFVDSTSDLTIVCTSGNVAGGFLGHSYEGSGNAFTMIIDENSAFTGKIMTTSGKGNLYFAMTSDYNNASNKFIIAGEEVKFNNGNIPAAANLGKIAVVKPTAGENAYVVAPVEGATSFVVYLNVQASAHNTDGSYVVNHNGMTWPLDNFDLETLAGYGLITKAVIVNGTDREYGYEIVDGVLTIYSGRSDNYCSGTVRLQVNQYDAEGNLLATGTMDVYTIEHPHTFVGGGCTTEGVCGCGQKQPALGHVWTEIEAKASTCTAAGYTAHKECDECGITEGKEALALLPHADDNGDYKCDSCSTKMLPAEGTALTIPQALAIAKLAGTSYTTQKYYITGIVKNVYNTTYGNMYIEDAEGNEICIYGLYSADGKTRYDAMSYKPVAGDEVTVYTVLGMYGTTYQGKNAWLDEVVHNHTYSDATCTEPATCSCGETSGNPLGHNYVEGSCSNCGGVDPDYEGEVSAPTYVKVTSADQLTTGTYVLVVNGYVMTKYDSSGWVLVEKFSGTGDTIVSDSIATWTLTVSGTSVTLKDANGTFIKPKSGNNNGIQTGSYNWAFTFSNGNVNFKGTGSDTTILAANVQSSNKIRAYKTSTVSDNASGYPSNFTLYKLVED